MVESFSVLLVGIMLTIRTSKRLVLSSKELGRDWGHVGRAVSLGHQSSTGSTEYKIQYSPTSSVNDPVYLHFKTDSRQIPKPVTCILCVD